MNRHKRIAILVNLCGLAGFCMIVRSAQAESPTARSICSRLVAQMRASPAMVLKDVVEGKTMQPWIVNASSRPAQGDPAYRQLPPVWRTMGGRGASFPTIESLPGTELSMVSAIAGSGDCLQYQFFERKQGGALRVLGDPPIKSDLCSRQGAWGSLATVLGEPSFVAYGSLNPDESGSLLNIMQWKRTYWAQACHVSIRLMHRYPVRLLYCGSDRAVCDAARRVAPAVEHRYETYSAEQLADFNEIGKFSLQGFQLHSAPTAEERVLVGRARRIAMSRVTAAESRGAPSWLRVVIPADVSFFPLRLVDNLYVASTTGGADPSSLIRWIVPDAKQYLGAAGPKQGPGSLLVVYQLPRARSHQLVPLAVLTMHSQTSSVKSIQADDDYAP